MFTELIFIIFILKKIYKNSLVSWIWSKGHPRSYNCYLVFMGLLQELNYWSFNNDYTNDILEYKTWNNINQTKLNLKIHYIESLLYKEVSIPPSCYNIILQLKTKYTNSFLTWGKGNIDGKITICLIRVILSNEDHFSGHIFYWNKTWLKRLPNYKIIIEICKAC